MKINPLKGMKDYLPDEMRMRDYVQGKILETYRASGFERISTPILEDMENLDKSEGGDNLNLIFKVLKRGENGIKVLRDGTALRPYAAPVPLLRCQPRKPAHAVQGDPDRPRVPRRASAKGPYARICAVRYRHFGR